MGIDLSSYKSQAVEIYLYNYLGQERMVKMVEKVDNMVVDLDVSNEQTGNYMVRIKSKGTRDVVKSVNIAH
jgi:hypothetical protein